MDGEFEDRIERLKRQAESLSGGPMKSHVSASCPPEIEEQFWRQVVAFESAEPQVQPFEMLEQSGVTLPSADELDDADLTARLWEVLNGLASLGVYLNFTDHLSDRELYVRLWRDTLREPMELQPESDAAWFIDMTGGTSEEGTLVYLKYYADENMRRHWAEDFPDDPMPDPARLPFDRDRHLPQPRWNRR